MSRWRSRGVVTLLFCSSGYAWWVVTWQWRHLGRATCVRWNGWGVHSLSSSPSLFVLPRSQVGVITSNSSDQCCLFSHCAGRNATSLVYLLPNCMGRLRWDGQCCEKLHWLDVSYRVTFKLAVMVHWCLNGRVPQYLAVHQWWVIVIFATN